ncbi:sulfurtransferase TusA family protein [Synechococcus sp. CS-1329]|uniref:sulfurtransferase TusA family protein n=1 Tax=Synechococcus sp. CS-1329 TaxID=2847975 RepID=UPI00223C40EE|nr:sulfurtransferase TusA family protein [Synechococcus sp. CS-1329]MCT0218816.1 sulfurtransferase TusA family protein [Synechococcus sp. CS-1329]
MTFSPASGSPPAQPSRRLDLRGTPCPLNFIRSRLALETLAAGEWLQLDLDAGEPERMVAEGLRQEGHRVEQGPGAAPETTETAGQEGVQLWICRHGG